MLHRGFTSFAAALVVLASAAPVQAALPLAQFSRGPGWYFSITKLLVVWLLSLMWVKSADWVNHDCQYQKHDTRVWNAVTVFSFLLAFILMLFIPYFLIGLPLLLLSWAVPLISYVVYRNGKVDPHEKVFTPGHIRFVVAGLLSKVGVKIEAEKKLSHDKGAPVDLKARGGATDRDNNVNLLTARQSPGFLVSKEIIAHALDERTELLFLDYTAQAVGIRYQVDGVWHPQESLDRESGDPVGAVVKQLANLNPQERRKKQQGEFGAEYAGKKYTCYITSEGVKTGERVLIRFDDGGTSFDRIPDLGMREKMQTQLKEIMSQPKGLILVSAPASHGLSTSFFAVVNSVDHYTRGFVGIEEKKLAEKERPWENVPFKTYDKAAGETPMTILPKAIREYPDVFVVRDLVDTDSARTLIDQVVEDNRLLFTSIKAKDCSEAMLRVLMLKVPPAKFAPAISVVLNQRLIRKLCDECKEAYEPPPQLLKQLGLPAGRIEHLYRPPVEPEKICAKCNGVGYYGRTALFEMLVPNDLVRQVLAQSPKLDLLRKAAKKAGATTIQQEGIFLVAKGETSLEELKRILKEG